jgi:hypothetical protein
MSAYTKAASFVLDSLWEHDEFRDFCYSLDAELADLGPLTQSVFEPAYLQFKASLDENALLMLESQVTADLLSPLLGRPGFREIWAQWDLATREEFIQEQSELQLARLLIQVYDQQLIALYKHAYKHYLTNRETYHG